MGVGESTPGVEFLHQLHQNCTQSYTSAQKNDKGSKVSAAV